VCLILNVLPSWGVYCQRWLRMQLSQAGQTSPNNAVTAFAPTQLT
jgi:hypothetical protein